MRQGLTHKNQALIYKRQGVADKRQDVTDRINKYKDTKLNGEVLRYMEKSYSKIISPHTKDYLDLMKKVTITEEELQTLLSAPETRDRGFRLVVDMYSQQIYWQLRRMVYSHDDADDLVQNTFIKAWEALDDFRGESKVSTWLYRIAMYEGLNYIKQEKRKSELYMRAEEADAADYLMTTLESDEYFDGNDYEKKFQEAIQSLPEKQSLVFRLRYYDEMPYEDIAKITGTSVGALKASYHHAVKKLESLLGDED